MGSVISHSYWDGITPEHIPPKDAEPGFDPQFGFKGQRIPRTAVLSQQEMKALQLPKIDRHYCAHHIRDYMMCIRKYAPFRGLCYPEFEAYRHCTHEDDILRMKEYEREKRLRIRELRKQGKAIE